MGPHRSLETVRRAEGDLGPTRSNVWLIVLVEAISDESQPWGDPAASLSAFMALVSISLRVSIAEPHSQGLTLCP